MYEGLQGFIGVLKGLKGLGFEGLQGFKRVYKGL